MIDATSFAMGTSGNMVALLSLELGGPRLFHQSSLGREASWGVVCKAAHDGGGGRTDDPCSADDITVGSMMGGRGA